MPRITKKPEVRRREIVETAIKHFTQKGYDNTTIDDIVSEIRVAKGLFYHYFKSKESVFEAASIELATESIAQYSKILDSTTITAKNKLIKVFEYMISISKEDNSLWKPLHNDRWRDLHNQVVKRIMTTLQPKIAAVIQQGVDENDFDVMSDTYTASAIVGLFYAISENDQGEHAEDPEREVQLLKDFISRVLRTTI